MAAELEVISQEMPNEDPVEKVRCCGCVIKGGSGEKNRKPPGNKWLQQQIPACRPVFSAKHVFVVFLVLGLLFLGLGVLFLITALRLQEIEIPYTNCAPVPSAPSDGGCDGITSDDFDTCENYIQNISSMSTNDRLECPPCVCLVNFNLPFDLQPPWNVYYMLRNYFQNHRRYLNSWDTNQLRGNLRSASGDCRPFSSLNSTVNYAPCGLIANSLFNDSFGTFTDLQTNSSVSCCNRTDIAWASDRSTRFRNPDSCGELDLTGTIPPPYWLRDLNQLNDQSGCGLENEGMIVWFRVSAFPNFRKLYGRFLSPDGEGKVMNAGNYSVEIEYNYPVSSFGGSKLLVLAEVSWLGGRNLFLGIAYIVVGSLALVVGTVLILVHLLCSKWKLTDPHFMERDH